MASTFGFALKVTGGADFQAQLKNATQSIKTATSELGKIDSQYGKTDESATKLTEKNKALKNAMEQAQSVAKLYKEQIEKSNTELDKAKSEHSKLKDTIDSEKQSLESIKAKYGDTSQEYTSQRDKLAKLESQYASQNIAINKSEASIGSYKQKLNDVTTQSNKFSNEIKENTEKLNGEGKEIDQESSKLGKFKHHTDSAGSGALKMGDIIKANLISSAIKTGLTSVVTGVTKLAGAFKEGISQASEMGEAVDKGAQRMQVSNKQYQELSYVAQMSGTSIGTLEKAQKSLAGSKYSNLSFTDALYKCADANDKAGLATEMFGSKAGRQMLPMLNEGSKGIKELQKHAEDYGLVMSDKAVKASAKFDDSLGTLKMTMTGMKNKMMGEFLPSVTQVTDGLSKLMTGDTSGLDDISDGIMGFMEQLNKTIPTILKAGGKIITNIIDGMNEHIPEIMKQGGSILSSLGSGIIENIPKLVNIATQVILSMSKYIIDMLPEIIKAGIKVIVTLVQGISQALPTLIPAMVDAILQMVDALTDNIDLLVDCAIQLVEGLAKGIIKALPILIAKAPVIIAKLVSAIARNLPKVMNAGIDIVEWLNKGIVSMIASAGNNAAKVATRIIKSLGSGLEKVGDIGSNLVKGLWNGINDAEDWVLDKIKGFGKGILNGLKSFFGIHSPSTVFKEEIGQYLAKGIGVGFEENMTTVSEQMQNAIPNNFDTSVSVATDISTNRKINESIATSQAYESINSGLSTLGSLLRTDNLKKVITEAVNNTDDQSINIDSREFARLVKANG